MGPPRRGCSSALYIVSSMHRAHPGRQVDKAFWRSPQKLEPFFGPDVRALLVRRWNQGVDRVFEPVIAELSRRNL